jgi:hypothetical protein
MMMMNNDRRILIIKEYILLSKILSRLNKKVAGIMKEPIEYIKISRNRIICEAYIKDIIYRDIYHTNLRYAERAIDYNEFDNEMIRQRLLEAIDGMFDYKTINKSILVILEPDHSYHVYNKLHNSLIKEGYKIIKIFDDGKRIIYEQDDSTYKDKIELQQEQEQQEAKIIN